MLKAGFYMSGKSRTIGDFTVSRLTQILPTNENPKSRTFPTSGMVGDKLGKIKRKRFNFPDASQNSAMVGDHSRYTKTLIFVPRAQALAVAPRQLCYRRSCKQ